jgi:ABC-type molybdate transport system substrate-binding protein
MKTKAKAHKGADAVMQAVAAGETELGFSTSSTILTARGVQLAGLFPREFQEYVVYTAGVSTGSKNAQASKALIELLTAEGVTPLMKAKGLERIAH